MFEPNKKSDSLEGSIIAVSIIPNYNSSTNLTEKVVISRVDGECFECDEIEEEYEPFDHRDQKHGNTIFGSLAHLLKSSLGTGILAMPMAFYNAGLIFGLVCTFVVGFLCTYCVHILVRTSQEMCRKAQVPALGFAETAEKVFEYGPMALRPYSRFARHFVDVCLMAAYYAVDCVYIVFIATSFHDVINHDCNLNWDVRIYIALTVIPCLFIGQVRNLKWLVPFSVLANLCIIVTFAITLYYMFNEPLEFADKPYIAQAKQIPLFFATVIFAMEGIGAVMPVENTMKRPRYFLGCPGVLNTAMFTVTFLYGVIGFFGYVRFGSAVLGSITLNLNAGAPLAEAAKLLMAIAILFTYGLQFYIPNEILWRKIGNHFNERRHNMVQIILRTCIILVSGCIAVAIPDLGPFISLVGAVFFSTLGIFLPSVIQSVNLWPDRLGFFKWQLVKNIILAVLAILALIAGAWASIEQIIAQY